MDNSNRADSLTVIDDSCFPASIRANTDLNNANVRVDICGRCKRRRLRLLVVDRRRSGFVSGFAAKLVF